MGLHGIAGGVLRGVGVVALPLLSWHLCTRVWDFPAPSPFRGPSLYDPYRGADFGPGSFVRANFHAHARSWGGLTAGKGIETRELRDAYARLGYDVAQVSDYMAIRLRGEGPGAWIPAYEHGYGVTKTHHLCLGASRVDWAEFPLFQTVQHKQTVLDRLRRSAEAVAIVHPHHWGYSLEDLRLLSGYHLLEVASSLPGDATPYWDAALSAGHPAFLLADDDSHGLEDAERFGRCVTFVGAPASDGAAILAALKAGRAWGVKLSHEAGETPETRIARLRDLPRPVAFSVDGGLLRVALSAPAPDIRFVGQGGKVLGSAVGAASAEYRIAEDDTYVRVEVRFGGETRIYLNPVFRYAGEDPTRNPVPPERVSLSRLLRIAAFLPLLTLAWLLLPHRLAKRLSSGRAARTSCEDDAGRPPPGGA